MIPSPMASHTRGQEIGLSPSTLPVWPLISTRFTVPLSAVVPRTATLPSAVRWTCVITVVGGRSSTGSSSRGNSLAVAAPNASRRSFRSRPTMSMLSMA